MISISWKNLLPRSHIMLALRWPITHYLQSSEFKHFNAKTFKASTLEKCAVQEISFCCQKRQSGNFASKSLKASLSNVSTFPALTTPEARVVSRRFSSSKNYISVSQFCFKSKTCGRDLCFFIYWKNTKSAEIAPNKKTSMIFLSGGTWGHRCQNAFQRTWKKQRLNH